MGWLRPGLHVKRWIGVMTVGVIILSLGIGLELANLYRSGTVFPAFVYYITLQFIPRLLRGLIGLGLGAGLFTLGFIQLGRSVLGAMLPARGQSVADTIYQFRTLQKGPRVVALGGGTGLSTLLRGLKSYTSHLTAVVTVADDGGSSGRLRGELRLLPPGDFRQVMVALADAEPLMKDLFQYRFEGQGALSGHSFGNIFIAAMAAITGNFEHAIRESSRVLAVRGQIIPSTLEDVTLWAEMEDGTTVAGESSITHHPSAVQRVYLRPQNCEAYLDVQQAILEADLVVVGPGSLFTSVLPNLLVGGVREALRQSKALRVYVCNVASQVGETEGYTPRRYLEVLEAHCGPDLFDTVVANSTIRSFPSHWKQEPVRCSPDEFAGMPYQLVLQEVVDEDHPTRHDSAKLAAVLQSLRRR